MATQETLKQTLVGVTIYPLTVPAGSSYPCATYQRISSNPIRSHAGNVMNKARYQISTYGESYSDCVALANTIVALLDLNQTDFELVTKENEFDVKEPESGNYSTKIDFLIWENII